MTRWTGQQVTYRGTADFIRIGIPTFNDRPAMTRRARVPIYIYIYNNHTTRVLRSLLCLQGDLKSLETLKSCPRISLCYVIVVVHNERRLLFRNFLISDPRVYNGFFPPNCGTKLNIFQKCSIKRNHIDGH